VHETQAGKGIFLADIIIVQLTTDRKGNKR